MTRHQDKRGGARSRQEARRGRHRASASGEGPTPSDSSYGHGRFRFGPLNYAAFALGLVAIVAGYVQLDNGSITAAPLLLIVGYAVLLPLGLILGWRRLD